MSVLHFPKGGLHFVLASLAQIVKDRGEASSPTIFRLAKLGAWFSFLGNFYLVCFEEVGGKGSVWGP